MRGREPGPVPGLVAPRRRANGKLIRDGGERDLFFSKTVQLKILGLKQATRTARLTWELARELAIELAIELAFELAIWNASSNASSKMELELAIELAIWRSRISLFFRENRFPQKRPKIAKHTKHEPLPKRDAIFATFP